MVAEALDALGQPWAASVVFDEVIDELVDLDGMSASGPHRPEGEVSNQLVLLLGGLWERGWEPIDVHHVLRRHGDGRAVRLLLALIAAEAAAGGRAGPMPKRWRHQMQRLGIEVPEQPFDGLPDLGADEVVPRWRETQRLNVADSLEVSLRVLAQLRCLGRLSPLGDPPSRWGVPTVGPGPALAGEPKHFGTIRALLAKAESTSFPAEAEAFTAKAQELMVRHSIHDVARAADANDDLVAMVRPHRIAIEQPYGPEKVQILAAVAGPNGVEVVWDDEWALATVVGLPADVELVELLFSSLLVQATQAMGQAIGDASHRRAPAFRRAFLLAFSRGLGPRLTAASARAGRQATTRHGTSLVPLLARRRDAVRRVTEQMFPDRSPMRTRMVDAEGWEAGNRAAAAAVVAPLRAATDRPDSTTARRS